MYSVSPGVIASSSGNWATNRTRTVIGTGSSDAEAIVGVFAGWILDTGGFSGLL